jgi:hypothetical protein
MRFLATSFVEAKNGTANLVMKPILALSSAAAWPPRKIYPSGSFDIRIVSSFILRQAIKAYQRCDG